MTNESSGWSYWKPSSLWHLVRWSAHPRMPSPVCHSTWVWYWIIPVSGLFAGLCTYIAVVSSLLHIGELNRLMVHSNQQSREEDSSVTDFPPIQGSFMIRHAPRYRLCLPQVFIITWVIVLIWWTKRSLILLLSGHQRFLSSSDRMSLSETNCSGPWKAIRTDSL